jgi:SAM-dependent methyltransferase
MKANTSRGGRLNFDQVAEEYDTGRPLFPVSLVERIRQTTSLEDGAKLLEIGAGTGQLTCPLRNAGFQVVALEPGERLRERLAAHVSDDSAVTIRDDFFESYDGAEAPFAAIWSANAFHWLDPAVSYAKAAELLQPGGHLVLLWSYPILAPELQSELNAKVFEPHDPQSVREPEGYRESLEADLAPGRDELAESGAYEDPEWWIKEQLLEFEIDHYVGMLMSYAHMIEKSEEEREQLGDKVRAVLAETGAKNVELVNYIYTCVARRKD